ncbi:MSHA biogenesis protein MshL [Dissulfuribacter thermophilus]|uniref:MSHA biogenesis protein MshL n=1 Tax=Dissulfuribacter thermophilus TaxID=1156395 RepID=A0A1B9F723_9BACT|nr:type II and III secretion system protein [Dissulfuribacter thermophilus]OCC15737.1 MSHA biogenesis protein MshL [Dissulfuribacter thermophilus]
MIFFTFARLMRAGCLVLVIFLGLFFTGCAPNTNIKSPTTRVSEDKEIKGSISNTLNKKVVKNKIVRPPIQWEPAFKVKDVSLKETANGLPKLPVGADISSQGGPVPLKEVMKRLSELKGFSISWASDVDQSAPVEVNIKSKDDFWETLTNILRQHDYFYEFKKNTIIIKYKDTQRFYVPAPFLTGTYKTSVGGDLLGSQETAQGMVRGTVSLEHSGDQLDIWETIKSNLDRILDLATTQASTEIQSDLTAQREAQIREACRRQYPSRPAQQALCLDRALAAEGLTRSQDKSTKIQKTISSPRSREGFFYTIDKPLGIITVTAPRSILEQVASYISTLNSELSKQVVIEAKILEVRLEKTHSAGVDWSSLLKDSRFGFNVLFGDGGRIYPTDGVKFISQVNLQSKAFDLLLNALNEYGHVRVLSNPKLTLMNGQAAMLTVGESVRYIDRVESTVDSETGIITYSVETQSILSGLGFSVMAQIAGNDEVVLQITPVTSQLQEPIEYRSFGSNTVNSEVGLPRVTLREMTTMAKVRSGEFLIIGGLIDELNDTKETKVPIVGDIPIVGNAFKNTRDFSNKRELIILLRPQIIDGK